MPKTEIVIYTKKGCPYCDNAKLLLSRKKANYREIDITDNQDLLKEMIEKSNGRKTVPQIFISGESIGGFDDLDALDGSGQLDSLLQEQ